MGFNKFDTFAVALAVLEIARQYRVELMPLPDNGPDFISEIVLATPRGHYFQLNQNYVCLYAIKGAAASDEYYKVAVPEHEYVGRFFMDVIDQGPSPDFIRHQYKRLFTKNS